MSEDYSAAAERIVNATNLADDDLSSFEADVRTVALGYLAQAARIAELTAVLEDFAEHGTRTDLLPTNGHVRDWKWWQDHHTRADTYVRERARDALAPGAAGRSGDARPVDPPDCPRCHRRMIPYQRDPEHWWICGRDDCRLVPIRRTDA